MSWHVMGAGFLSVGWEVPDVGREAGEILELWTEVVHTTVFSGLAQYR